MKLIHERSAISSERDPKKQLSSSKIAAWVIEGTLRWRRELEEKNSAANIDAKNLPASEGLYV